MYYKEYHLDHKRAVWVLNDEDSVLPRTQWAKIQLVSHLKILFTVSYKMAWVGILHIAAATLEIVPFAPSSREGGIKRSTQAQFTVYTSLSKGQNTDTQ